MPKQPKEKSARLQELEAVFDRHARRFSPFDVLGLRPNEPDAVVPHVEEAEVHEPPTHGGVGATHPHEPPTHTPVGGTHPHGGESLAAVTDTTTEAPPTHRGVGTTHPLTGMQEVQSSYATSDVRVHKALAATQMRAQLGRKARRVLGYLNSIRSLDQPASTVSVGYTQISAAAAVHPHYLRRDVLPKLAMLGLISVRHKSLYGTIYHLHYDAAFLHMVAGEEETPRSPSLSDAPTPVPQHGEGCETPALQGARQERDRALQERALAEEALCARQEAAKARFLAALADTQLQWLKQEAKRRVDVRPSVRFLTPRYPLYKAEEDQLVREWMDRTGYGENVPHAVPEEAERVERA